MKSPHCSKYPKQDLRRYSRNQWFIYFRISETAFRRTQRMNTSCTIDPHARRKNFSDIGRQCFELSITSGIDRIYSDYDVDILYVWTEKDGPYWYSIDLIFDGVGGIYEAYGLCTFSKWYSSYYPFYLNGCRCKYPDL